MTRFASPIAAACLAAVAFAPSTAFATAAAGPEACGNIRLETIGECHFEFDGGCEAQCEPLSFVAACDGQCNASIDTSCDLDCNAACVAECEVDPGAFECSASCEADCAANLGAECGGDTECEAYLEAECSASCEAECNVVPASASCEAQCNGCCTGSCSVEANFDCSLDCSAEMQGGCAVDCRQPEGALFCDGQYVAVQDLPGCIEYLIDNLDVEIEAEAQASITTSCSYVAAPIERGAAWGGFAALVLGLGFARRRRS
jgi:MYXO-CTERM domain-containing protein